MSYYAGMHHRGAQGVPAFFPAYTSPVENQFYHYAASGHVHVNDGYNGRGPDHRHDGYDGRGFDHQHEEYVDRLYLLSEVERIERNPDHHHEGQRIEEHVERGYGPVYLRPEGQRIERNTRYHHEQHFKRGPGYSYQQYVEHGPDGNINNVTVTANNVNNVNYFDGPARGVGHVLNPLAPAFDNRAAPLRIADEDRDEMPLHSLPTTSLRLEPEARIRTLSPQSSAYDGDRGGEGGRTPASESPPYNGGSRTPAGPRDASLAPPREEFHLSPQEFIQFIQSHIEVPLRAAGERALLQVLVQHEDDLRVGLMVPHTPSPPPPIVSTPPKRYVEIEEGLWMIVDPRDHSPGSDSNFYDSVSEADSRDNTMEYRKVPDGQYGEYFAEDEGQAEDQVYAEYTSSEDEEFYHLPEDGMDAEDQVDAEHLFSEDGAYTEHPFPDDEALTDYDDPYSEPDPSEAPYSPQPPSPDRLQRPAPAAYSEPESDENHSGPSIFSTPDPADFARRRNSIMRPPAGAEPVFANLIRGSTMFRISASRQTSRRSSNEQRSLIVRCRRRLKEQRRRSSGSDSESDLDDNAIPQPRARLGLGLRNNCGHTLSPLFPVGAAARQAGGVNASPALATVNAATGQRRLPADFAPALTTADTIANLQRTRAGRSRTPPSSYAEGGDELDASGTDSSRTMPASPPSNKRARDDDEDDGEVQFLGPLSEESQADPLGQLSTSDDSPLIYSPSLLFSS